MNVTTIAQTRKTTKAYDETRKIPEEIFEQLRTLIRFAPSSVNSQPWHFVVASTDEGKARIAKSTVSDFVYNDAKIRKSSHVIVFCSQLELDQEHMSAIITQEENDGRFSNPKAKEHQQHIRTYYADLHRFDKKDLSSWMEKQIYLAVGTLLLGAATFGVDATPMEGFDPRILDLELGLRERNLTSVVMVALGYRGEGDANGSLPKSRLSPDYVFTDI